MKLTLFLPALAAVCALALPISADAKDKRDKQDKHDKHEGNERHDRDDHRGRDHDDHYRGPNVIIRPSYGYGYGGYGYGYGSSYYRHSPYYYSRPSIGYSYYSRPSSVYRGQQVYGSYSDSLAVDVQRELRRRGYYRGSLDGDIGPGSRAAIRAYQYDRGLSATGRIDSSLLRSLGIG